MHIYIDPGFTEQVPKYDAYLLDRVRDIRQNHWTKLYRSRPDVVMH